MPAIAAMVAYIGLFPIGLFTTQCCYAAQILNIIRKSGMPKMSIDYAQSIVFMDEFRALTYLMSIVMMPKGFFIHTPLLIGVALGLCHGCGFVSCGGFPAGSAPILANLQTKFPTRCCLEILRNFQN